MSPSEGASNVLASSGLKAGPSKPLNSGVRPPVLKATDLFFVDSVIYRPAGVGEPDGFSRSRNPPASTREVPFGCIAMPVIGASATSIPGAISGFDMDCAMRASWSLVFREASSVLGVSK